MAKVVKFAESYTPLLVEREGGPYYTGPLGVAKQIAADERGVAEGSVHDDAYRVVFTAGMKLGAPIVPLDEPDRSWEWGEGANEDEAWRHALGALFRYLYDDEDAIRQALRETMRVPTYTLRVATWDEPDLAVWEGLTASEVSEHIVSSVPDLSPAALAYVLEGAEFIGEGHVWVAEVES